MNRRAWILALGCLTALATAMPALATDEPIAVGVIANLTGSDVKSSLNMVRGVELGAEAVNAAGGVGGRPIKLIVEDSEYRTQEALNAATKLYDVDKVQAAIMFGGSSLMIPVAEMAKQKGRVLLNTSSSSPKLGQYPGTLFSILPLDDIVGKELGGWVASQGIKSAAFVVPNNTFGTGLMEAAGAAFEAGGGRILRKVAYTEGQPDYRADIQPVVQAKPEAIIAAGYGDDSAAVFKNARELGLQTPWYTAYPSIFTIENPAWMEGKLFGVDNGGYGQVTGQKLRQAYLDKYKEEPLAHVFYGYDAVQLLALAMGKGGTDAAGIAKALPEVVKGYEGATGPIVWDERGQRIDPPIDLIALKGGKLETVSTKN
jgi:branched-chain amino acid transport system substrate-binding protein